MIAISVKDPPYNAVGNGTVDDSAAFQAAVNALAGAGVALFVPAGTYKVLTAPTLRSDVPILISADTTFTGAGAAALQRVAITWPPKYPSAARTIMPLGDSTTICADTDNVGQAGSWRRSFEARLRGRRSDFEFIGTQLVQPMGAGGLHNWFHEGHGGYTFALVNTNFASYVASTGIPDIIVLELGINDVATGRTATQMEADLQTLAATIYATCPNVTVVICGTMPFAAGTTPGANLATWNATISTFNTWVQSTFIPAQRAAGQTWIYLDMSFMGLGEHQSDGVHPHREGLAEWGLRLADLCDSDPRLLGPSIGTQAKTRLYAAQPPINIAYFPTAATDTITVAAYGGASPASGSFAVAFDFFPTSLPTAAATAIASWGTQGTANFWAITQQGSEIYVWWGNATNPVIGPAGAWPGTYTGSSWLGQSNALIANKWHRIVLLADINTGTIALYVNGALVGVATGIAAWTMAATATLTLRAPSNATANNSFMGRFYCFKPSSMPRPGSYAAAALVERDLYYSAPLFPGAFSARYDLSVSPQSSAGQFLVGDPALTLNGTAGLASPFGGFGAQGFASAPQPWQYGGTGFNALDPGT